MAEKDAHEGHAPHVLAFPFPAYGNMLPMLDFAHQLSLRGVSVTVVVTTKNLHHLSALLAASPSVYTLVLPFPAAAAAASLNIPPGVESADELPPYSFLYMSLALSSSTGPLSPLSSPTSS